MSNGSTAVSQNCQVTKSNKTCTLRESSPKRFAKDRMGLHELSHHLEDNQSMFSIKEKQKKKNQIKSKSQKNRKECHEHCTIFHCIALLHTKPAFIAFQDKSCMHLHPKNHVHVKCIYFSVYTNFPNLMSNLVSLG